MSFINFDRSGVISICYIRVCNLYHKYFRTSLQFGITALKKVNYDRVALDDRRRNSEEDSVDVLVWTNERVMKWVAAIGLKVNQWTCLSVG